MQAQQHLEEKQNTLKATSPEVKVATNQTSSSSSKKRVAHVPPLQIRQTPPNKSATVRPFNTPVMGINAKIQQKYSIGHSASYPTGHPSKTVAISAPKGERRLAHLPQKVSIICDVIIKISLSSYYMSHVSPLSPPSPPLALFFINCLPLAFFCVPSDSLSLSLSL